MEGKKTTKNARYLTNTLTAHGGRDIKQVISQKWLRKELKKLGWSKRGREVSRDEDGVDSEASLNGN